MLPVNGANIGPIRLEEFGWFGGMLEEFVRENIVLDEKRSGSSWV